MPLAGAARACLEANALGTLTLLQQAAAQGVGHATVVSSGNVYRFDDDAPVVETAPTYPSERAAFYLGSKLLAEVWARHVASTTSLRVAVVRPSAIYGPGMRGGVVRVFVDRLRGGEPVQVQEGGAFASDLVYVDADDLTGDPTKAEWSHKLLLVVDRAEVLLGGAEPSADNHAVHATNPTLVDLATNHVILDITLLARKHGLDCTDDVAPLMRPHL